MKVAGPQILGTGAKFKRVPCQKSCRVNRACDRWIVEVPTRTILYTEVIRALVKQVRKEAIGHMKIKSCQDIQSTK